MAPESALTVSVLSRPPAVSWGIRNQSTAAAVVVVACALLAGGILLLVLLQNALTVATDGVLRSKTTDVAAVLSSGDVAEAGQSIASAEGQGLLIQIVDGAGRVVQASDPELMKIPMGSLRPDPGENAAKEVSALAGVTGDADGEFYLMATGALSGTNQYVVLAARSIQVQADTVRTVALFLLLATPALLLIVAMAVRFLVGRSLRQVETIRAQVSDIDAGHLADRVDVPPTRDELAALAMTMNAMLGRIETADTRQRQFVSHASHELRSPLTTLRTGLEVSAQDPTHRTWLDMAPLLAAETRRMGYLVEDLLTLSKAEDSGLQILRADVDLDDVLAAELQRLRTTTGREVLSRVEPVRVSGDTRRFSQILRNVLDNADRHATHTVRATLTSADGTATLWVDNDGLPVPEAEREHIFERFIRLDESRSRDTGGSGLGLAIARSLLAAHGGTITAGEASDGFCRFEIQLPLLESL